MIFVMHIRRQSCTCCGAQEQLSFLYQAEEVARPGQAKKLLPCHTIGPGDPVHKVELPESHIPICAACVSDDVTRIGHDVYQSWAETIERKYAPTPAPIGAARTPHKSPPPTLEDLA